MKKTLMIGMAAALAAVLFSTAALAAGAGQFTEVQGTVSVQKPDNKSLAVKVGSPVAEGDLVKTEKNGKATILLKDGSVLKLGPSTNLRIKKLQQQPEKGTAQAAYDVASGAVMFVVGSVFGSDDSDFEVKTPTSVSGVRGTIGIVAIHTDPSTGQPVTTIVSLENTVYNTDNRGNTNEVKTGEYVEAPVEGFASPPAPIPQKDLDILLDLFTIDNSSLDDRAFDIRSTGGSQAPKDFVAATVMPEFVIPPGGGPGDFDPTAGNPDNPADIIYQEPPQATELNIIINIGGGGP